MKIIKRGRKVDRPRWQTWAGANGSKESAQLKCNFCDTLFILKKGDHVLVREDCLDGGCAVVAYFIQCPNCGHRAKHERAKVESDAT